MFKGLNAKTTKFTQHTQDKDYEVPTFPWFILGLMASVTFVGILSELVPSGILPQMTEGLGVEESEVGFLVGVYALASAIAAIPLISATLAFNRKTLLNVEYAYGIEVGKPANFLVLDAKTPFDAVRQRADVLASIRHGAYLFKRPDPSFDIALDLFRKIK